MKTTTTIKSVDVLGKVYEIRLWREFNGYGYSVKGSLITFGWAAGNIDEAIAEAISHIRYNNTPGKWVKDN